MNNINEITKTRLPQLEKEWFAIFNLQNAAPSSALENFLAAHPDFNIDVVNNEGNTALIMAARRGHPTKVRILLEHNANPNIKNLEGDTALLRAARKESINIIQDLIDHGADLNVKNHLGQNALLMACGDSRPILKNIKFLLSKGFSVLSKDNNLDTPLHYAIKSEPSRGGDWLDIVQLLLLSGAEVLAVNKKGYTPLMYAIDLMKQNPTYYQKTSLGKIMELLKQWMKEDEI